MKQQLYALRDIKQAEYLRIIQQKNEGEATRTFTEITNNQDPNNLVNRYPDDYELMHLGEFDTETGEITATRPRQIGLASAFKR